MILSSELAVRLHGLDPDSMVRLYNGGHDNRFFNCDFPFERFGAVVYPNAQPVVWGLLHPFALACMQFAKGGLVAFHDYADYFPGVKPFVNELL
jgi:hypothetical protein